MGSKRPADGVGVLSLLLLALACQPPLPPPALAQCRSQFESTSENPVVLRVGQVETLTFNVQVSSVCDGLRREAESIVVEAADDTGREIPLMVRQTRSNSSFSESVALEVTFTTPETSSVGFRIRAEPSIGLIQRFFSAVTLTSPNWDGIPTASTCTGAVEGPGGLRLCLEPPYTVTLLGSSWSRGNVNGLAFTSDALWVFLGSGGAEAWSFDGGVGEPVAVEPFRLVPSALHTRGRRVVLAGPSQTSKVALVQLEVGAQVRGPVPLFASDVEVGALRFVTDDEVELARGERLDVVLVPSVTTTLVLPAPMNQRVRPLSVSEDGLWSSVDPGGPRNPGSGTGGGPPGSAGGPATGNQDVQLVRADGGVSRVGLGFTVAGLGLPPMHLADAVPLWRLGLTTTGLLVTAVPFDAPDGGLALRYLGTDTSQIPSWANSRWIYGPPTPGRLLRIRRAP